MLGENAQLVIWGNRANVFTQTEITNSLLWDRHDDHSRRGRLFNPTHIANITSYCSFVLLVNYENQASIFPTLRRVPNLLDIRV